MKRWIANLLLLLVSSGFCLLLAEVVVALARPQGVVTADILGRSVKHTTPRLEAQEILGVQYRQFAPSQESDHTRIDGTHYTYRINADGVRSNGSAWLDGAPEVLILGDSQTFGFVNDDKTISAWLEQHLRASNVRVNVINAGHPGYSTYEILGKLRNVSRDGNVVLVVAAFHGGDTLVGFVGPDLTANFAKATARGNKAPKASAASSVSDLGERGAPNKTVIAELRGWARSHSHLYALLASIGEQWTGRDYASRVERDGRLDRAWAVTQSLFCEIGRVSHSTISAPVLILHLPELREIYAGYSAAEKELAAMGFPLVTTTQALQSAANGDIASMRWPVDAHFSPRANEVIAAQLLPSVQRYLNSESIAPQPRSLPSQCDHVPFPPEP